MQKPKKQGTSWSEEEERTLYAAFTDKSPIQEIAQTLERTEGAIRSHLRKMGLIDSLGVTVLPPPAFAPTAPVRKRSRKGAGPDKKQRRVIARKPEEPATEINLSPVFKTALKHMEETAESIFITGKAGTGKSTLLSLFCKTTKKDPVVLAPTGVAALNIKGQTIHSFFNFYVDVTPQKIKDKKTKPRNAKLYKKLKTIIIDEISMVRADLLDCIDIFLRLYGPSPSLPFGGVQMIFVGDLYQLPPVVGSTERELFKTQFETPYFFSALVMQDFPLHFIELDKIYRQDDPAFITILNQIRTNAVLPETLRQLNQRVIPVSAIPSDKFYITLTTTNRAADEINERHLNALSGKAFVSQADIAGNFSKEYHPTALDLTFKTGAQIMMLNNDSAKRWVNGSIGKILGIKTDHDNDTYLEVLLDGDKTTVDVYPHTWEVFQFTVDNNTVVSEPVGTFTQFPLRLAWAVTIHKSQGKTFDHVVIDMGAAAFAPGQTYVALSRCRSLEGIVLARPIGKQHIKTDPSIGSFFLALHSNPDNKAADPHFLCLIDAIKQKSAVKIIYLKGDDTQTERTIYPIDICPQSYKGHKFLGLRAFCTQRKEERVFTLNRVLSAKHQP